MKDVVFSILLSILIEAVGAVVSYLKNRFVVHMNRSSDGMWQNHPEFV